MNFEIIDVSKWERREYFEYFFKEMTCTFSITLNLDITTSLKRIKEKNLKFYPTMIYRLSVVVNRHKEFRVAIDEKGNVGVFDKGILCMQFYKRMGSFLPIFGPSMGKTSLSFMRVMKRIFAI